MNMKRIFTRRKIIGNYLIIGASVGALFTSIEYFARINTDNPQDFTVLIVKGIIAGLLIMSSVLFFELLLKKKFMQKPFLYLVLVRSFFFAFVISIWIFIINDIWFVLSGNGSFYEGFLDYLNDYMYLVNLSSSFLALILVVGLGQINSLHRKGELLNFVLGKYHTPREVDRIFCFIDLKSSTTIAEKLGHVQYAKFLKDYYTDITEALRTTKAQIYQYVGDEVVLSWSFKEGLKNNNLVNCFFKMKEIIKNLKSKYITKYGVYPEFKAGLHGGQVIVTWVGEIKKEIVYIGDVLNTTARIQEDCKRLEKDFLISEDLLNSIEGLGSINASYVEETTPRGKEQQVKLYSLDLAV